MTEVSDVRFCYESDRIAASRRNDVKGQEPTLTQGPCPTCLTKREQQSLSGLRLAWVRSCTLRQHKNAADDEDCNDS